MLRQGPNGEEAVLCPTLPRRRRSLLRRDHHTLLFEDVPDFYSDDLLVEHSVDELAAMRDKVAQANLPEADREQALAMKLRCPSRNF